jgi:hypothetical protein
MKTIGVSLWGGQVRGHGQNHATLVRSAQVVDLPRTDRARRTIRELYLKAYPRFAPALREIDEPGVAIVAIDELSGRAAGIARLYARVDRHVAAIIGRHDACDLYLSGSASLALRHLAVVLDPVTSYKRGEANVQFRVFDLRTTEGLVDEEGRQLRGLRAEGPALLRCGGYAVCVFPIGDPTDWPASATDAWDMTPERVYFDELEQPPNGSLPGVPLRGANLNTSVIMRTHGPRDTGMKLVTQGDVAGTIEIQTPHNRGAITVGEGALRDGVLLGRYARCDGAGLADDPSLSRVHAMIINIDDRLLAIDTASFNGTRIHGEERARVIPLDAATDLRLGSNTKLRWRWLA